MPKIYILGSVGSGKTTLARKLSKELKITHYELDSVTWEYNPIGNDRKRTNEEIETIFLDIISNDNWIIENVGKDIYDKGFKVADTIIYLNLPKCVLYRRIFFRWVKQNFKIEIAPSKPNIKMLRQMITWANKELKNSKLKKLKPYKNKLVILDEKSIKRYKYKSEK